MCSLSNSFQVPALSMDRVVMDLRRFKTINSSLTLTNYQSYRFTFGVLFVSVDCVKHIYFRQDIERDRILPTYTIDEIFQAILDCNSIKMSFQFLLMNWINVFFRNTIFHCPPTVLRHFTWGSGMKRQMGGCPIMKRSPQIMMSWDAKPGWRQMQSGITLYDSDDGLAGAGEVGGRKGGWGGRHLCRLSGETPASPGRHLATRWSSTGWHLATTW